ncbi:GIY-YIG nuclease family protein (plasmid) [Acidiphilium multivorum]|jgi:putative endonuclease|uniref:GIY-YIG nuclease family protein n=1 Tax=Acidiphilium TaxID=522 RepID=UPI00157BA5DA|nr:MULTISPECIES: GIY-YIG nuclease family protein [Acidiphilium]UNC16233.1 GIY-YIG nuclease family protein [Acidiphilium multivorum]
MPTAATEWSVYLLECRSGALYCGIAVDVYRRFAAHAAGKGARFTRMDPPVRLLLVEPCPDRSSALKREFEIKRLSRASKLALVADAASDAMIVEQDEPQPTA